MISGVVPESHRVNHSAKESSSDDVPARVSSSRRSVSSEAVRVSGSRPGQRSSGTPSEPKGQIGAAPGSLGSRPGPYDLACQHGGVTSSQQNERQGMPIRGSTGLNSAPGLTVGPLVS